MLPRNRLVLAEREGFERSMDETAIPVFETGITPRIACEMRRLALEGTPKGTTTRSRATLARGILASNWTPVFANRETSSTDGGGSAPLSPCGAGVVPPLVRRAAPHRVAMSPWVVLTHRSI